MCDNFAVWSCVQTALKAANSVVGLAGMDVILYALWVLRAWSKQHSVVGLAQLLTVYLHSSQPGNHHVLADLLGPHRR
uniref:Uncharacterized protein n=1 Tax=Aegilops tauschii subsp. strangulata TaxID=200361 RepID=A0A452ZF68_AEGTS